MNDDAIITTLTTEAQRHEALATVMPPGIMRRDHEHIARILREAAKIIEGGCVIMPTKRELKQSLEFMGVLSGQLNPDDCKALGKPPQRRRQHEAGEQAALFQWARLMEKQRPELALLFHVPNGTTLKGGAIEGAHMKAQGVRAGVPDLCLPVARGCYHGLYIELKATGGRVQDMQRVWIDALAGQGYRAVVCYGFEAAKAEIERYLAL
ncbi:MAG: VRR-NUC domain-containing protein [Oscillospiraceae bacterium]|nr:VRR-NUC domain-containing protein [Oscillospiraceae bacterium]